MRLPFWQGLGQEKVNVFMPSDQGSLINLGTATIPSGQSSGADLDVSGFSSLLVIARIGNATTPATAAGDISVGLQSYEADAATLFPAGMPGFNTIGGADAVADRGASLSGSFAFLVTRYNVEGLTKIRLSLSNNNLAALQGGKLDYFLQ